MNGCGHVLNEHEIRSCNWFVKNKHNIVFQIQIFKIIDWFLTDEHENESIFYLTFIYIFKFKKRKEKKGRFPGKSIFKHPGSY